LKVWKILGPGLITGAADDDPSGIATYSQTGAQFGYSMLWTAIWQIPLLIAVQEACARIGCVTGKGLAGVIKDNYSKKVLVFLVLLVVCANVINLGADIGAIATSVQLIVNIPFNIIAIISAVVIILLEVFVSYRRYVPILKWLGLALVAYVITGLMIHEPWGTILSAAVIPHIKFNVDFLFLIVGVFGTTISPYMFFWEASQEVEEEISLHMIESEGEKPVKIKKFLGNMRIDNTIGMLFAEVIQFFIIVVCATLLFGHGITNISTAAQAAQALQPFAGIYAKDLFAVGVIGVGLMAIPVFAGSASYAISETFGWKEGLYRKLSDAKAFYGVIIAATLVGLLMNFIGINPIKALVWTAVFNGIAAVPLIFVIGKINSSKKILGKHTGGWLSRTLVGITFVVMGLAGLALILSTFHF
jgi:NRAMP (natural resistance-associated macrophage protein)-like metal ion transporter